MTDTDSAAENAVAALSDRTTCKWCGDPLPDRPEGATGRRPDYCKEACSGAAKRARRAARGSGTDDALRQYEAATTAAVAGLAPVRDLLTDVLTTMNAVDSSALASVADAQARAAEEVKARQAAEALVEQANERVRRADLARKDADKTSRRETKERELAETRAGQAEEGRREDARTHYTALTEAQSTAKAAVQMRDSMDERRKALADENDELAKQVKDLKKAQTDAAREAAAELERVRKEAADELKRVRKEAADELKRDRQQAADALAAEQRVTEGLRGDLTEQTTRAEVAEALAAAHTEELERLHAAVPPRSRTHTGRPTSTRRRPVAGKAARRASVPAS